MYKLNPQTLQFELDQEKAFKYKLLKKATIILTSLIVLLLFYFQSDAQKSKDTILLQKTKIQILESNLDSLAKTKDLSLTIKTVDWIIDLLPFKNKAMIKKQYRVESGHLKSNLTYTNNNIFGMKNAGNRPQPGTKSKINDFRKYEHFIFSIFDRYLFELKHGTSLKGYAEDVNYLDKIK